ncbi:MAG TPA: thioredoxin domain-containing protein [Bryobacteraceae bacterium]|nr:thioredoxin domain-containing protein [Bryobacteraceae bacterium]
MRVYFAALICCAALSAQAPSTSWQTSDKLGSIDLSALTPAQKQAVLKITREQDCSCLCGMKVAECVNRDPNCSYSKALTAIAIKGVQEGKSLVEISKLMDASPKAHRPKLLEDPVAIPVAGSPTRGPNDARITIVEFSDFECPYCSIAVGEVNTIMSAYPKDIKLIYKQFPLSMHPHAPMAAAASLAANQQGKFWQMHDALFKNFRKLSRENILALAKEIGLDMTKFIADLDSPKYQAVVQKDVADGETAGVYGTPSFFINGKHYNGPLTLESVKPILDAELHGGKLPQAASAH